VRCDECLFEGEGHEGLVPPRRESFELRHFDVLSPPRPETWSGRSWIWFCGTAPNTDPPQLRPHQWRTYWPIERRAETEALIEELGRRST
jgi:hypothetical protein